VTLLAADAKEQYYNTPSDQCDMAPFHALLETTLTIKKYLSISCQTVTQD
jgi:hypothetical protein